IKTSYEVRMSDADFGRVTSGQAPIPDPYNPDTLPVGSSVMLDSTDFHGTGFEASYRNIKVETNTSHEEGVSVAVEKTGENTVRVTAGPTEAVEDSFKLGASLGPASAHLGNTTRTGSTTLKTAEFDLSTPEGQAAYNNFVVSGRFPSENGTGVSDVSTTQRFQYDSASSAGGALGPWAGSVPRGDSSLGISNTTYPDGSMDQVTNGKHVNGTPFQLEQHFNADGSEDLTQRAFSMSLVDADVDSETSLAEAYGADASAFEGDKHIQLSIDSEQAIELSQRARDHIERWERTTGRTWTEPPQDSNNQVDRLITALADAQTPEDVLQTLMDVRGGPRTISGAFSGMSSVYGEQVPLPGTLEARNRDA
ncbi:MAG TPA: hypothetical protein VGB96_07690, partial [Archangium sp.]